MGRRKCTTTPLNEPRKVVVVHRNVGRRRMSELKHNGPGAHRGHPIDIITIEREVYWLAAVFAASRTLHDLTPDEEEHEFDSLRLRFETSEASRLLISVAVMLRNLMDAGAVIPLNPGQLRC